MTAKKCNRCGAKFFSITKYSKLCGGCKEVSRKRSTEKLNRGRVSRQSRLRHYAKESPDTTLCNTCKQVNHENWCKCECGEYSDCICDCGNPICHDCTEANAGFCSPCVPDNLNEIMKRLAN